MNKTKVILDYLKNGNRITDAKAVELCNNYRLSSTIHELRHRHGYNIAGIWKESNGNKYMEYFLINEMIEENINHIPTV